MTDYSLAHFYDSETEFFRFTSDLQLDEALIATHFETEDNVIPASNLVMGEDLLLLFSPLPRFPAPPLSCVPLLNSRLSSEVWCSLTNRCTYVDLESGQITR